MQKKLVVSLIIASSLLLVGITYFIFRSSSQSSIPQKSVKQIEKIKLSYGTAAILIPIIGAKEGGFLDKYGIEMELIKVSNSAEALASKSVDVVIINGFSSMLTAAVQGHDFVWIAAPTNNTELALISRVPKEKIRSAAVSRIGAVDHQRMLLGLRLLKIDPSNITFITTGSELQSKIATFSKGQIDLISLRKSEWEPYRNDVFKGTEIIFNFADIPDRLIPLSVVTRRDIIEQNPSMLIKLLAVILEGSVYAKQNWSNIESVLIHEYGMTEEVARNEMDMYFRSVKNLQFVPDIKPVETILPIIALEAKEASNYNAGKFIDDSFAKEAMKQVDFSRILSVLNN